MHPFGKNSKLSIPSNELITTYCLIILCSSCAGEKTLYFASTTDPDGDDIYYKFSWGDGTDSGWVGPFPSGTLADANHTWSARGDYTIKVKAKDTHGLETDWSDPLPIRVPKGREMFNHPLLLKILNRLIELFPLLKNLILN